VLSEAATLEHMIMCEYLFAAFSMKNSESEGIGSQELEKVRNWEGVITAVAIQEMTHLALVNNMLVSIGHGPYFQHPNFPHPSKYFGPNVRLALMPFGEQALKHFLHLERPEGMAVEGVPGFEVMGDLTQPDARGGILPQKQYFSTVGNLYRGIEEGFKHLAAKLGEDGLFLGASGPQATEDLFGLPSLFRVTSLDSAARAIEGIVEMGEGARGDWEHSHFGMFLRVFQEFTDLKKANPGFNPTKPIVAAYSRPPPGGEEVPLITVSFTSRVSDLFSASYSLAIGVLSRMYVHQPGAQKELSVLANTAVGLMTSVVKPLGNILTSLPVGSRLPGLNAGPTFVLQQHEYTLPNRESAFMILQERLIELADHSMEVSSLSPSHQVAARLMEIGDASSDLARDMTIDT
jgi:hypothetical protein